MFNGRLRDELRVRQVFYTLTEAQVLIERWRRRYNMVRLHSALGYRSPAPAAITPPAVDEQDMSGAPLDHWNGSRGQVIWGFSWGALPGAEEGTE